MGNSWTHEANFYPWKLHPRDEPTFQDLHLEFSWLLNWKSLVKIPFSVAEFMGQLFDIRLIGKSSYMFSVLIIFLGKAMQHSQKISNSILIQRDNARKPLYSNTIYHVFNIHLQTNKPPQPQEVTNQWWYTSDVLWCRKIASRPLLTQRNTEHRRTKLECLSEL